MKKFFVLVLSLILGGSLFAQSHPFSGFWARKTDIGTLLLYFTGSTYQLIIAEESQTASMGVFSAANNQLKLYDVDGYKEGAAAFTYAPLSEESFVLSKDVNDTPLVGLWVKLNMADPPREGKFANLMGVWEARGSGIAIIRVFPDGEGWFYSCGADMALKDCFRIKLTAAVNGKGKMLTALESFDGWADAGVEYRLEGDAFFLGNNKYARK
jgi:hypothetical protein